MKLFNKSVKKSWIVSAALALMVSAISLPALQVFAATCDSNAVMYCGASTKADVIQKIDNGDGRNSSANLKQIYYNEGRGITEAGINASVDGEVHKDGTVWVNGQKVASGVFSSGREYMQNSTKDGSLWMRPPAVSFNSDSLSAFVNMSGGTFHFAILKACGNIMTPTAAPFGSIYKRVVDVTKNPAVNYAADDNAHALEVDSTDVVRYEISIVNDGNTDVTNAVMTDSLPTGVTLISNPAKRDFSVPYGTVKNGNPLLYTLTVKVDQNVANGTYITNKACFTADQGQKGCDTTVIKIKKPTETTPPATVTPTVTPTATNTVTPAPTVTPIVTPTATPKPTATPCVTATPAPTTTPVASTTPTATPTNTTCATATQTPKPTVTPVVTATPSATPCVDTKGGVTCQTTTATPAVTTPASGLPDTGAETPIAGMFGMGGMSYAGMAYIKSKKQLSSALRNWKK